MITGEDFKPLGELADEVSNAFGVMSDAVTGDFKQAADKIMETVKKKIDEINNPKLILNQHLYDIVLPAPNTVMDEFNHRYSFSEMAPIDQLYKTTTGTVASLIPGMKDLIQSVIQKDIEIANRNNYTVNLNVLNTYSGTDLRRFNFEIDFLFSSQDEAETVFKAIQILKKHSCAVQSNELNGSFLSMSSVFKFSFGSPKYNEILNIQNNQTGLFFLNEVSVNLGEGQNYINKFSDGVPKYIKLNLSFTSRQPEYLNYVEKE